MNSKQYLTCDWVVRLKQSFFSLIEELIKLSGNLAVKKDLVQQSDGLTSYRFVISADSEEKLEVIKQVFEAKLGLCDWQPATVQEYSDGNDLVLWWKAAAGNMKNALVDAFTSTALKNERLLDQLQEKKKYLYFACDWIAKESCTESFAQAYEVADHLGLLMYQLNHWETQNGCHIVKIGIRVPSENMLKTFVGQAGKSAGLDSWHLVSRDNFYSGMKFVDLDDINNFLSYMQNYAQKNKELNCQDHF